jgi:hypothetical protein
MTQRCKKIANLAVAIDKAAERADALELTLPNGAMIGSLLVAIAEDLRIMLKIDNREFIDLAINNNGMDQTMRVLYDALEATGGFLDWAADHGADREAIDAIRKMRKQALLRAKGELGE